MTVINARVLADSISEAGTRLTTLEVTFPRFVLAEFNTHRMFSRNSASSRAIPSSKMIERVRTDPARPIEWGSNKAGMQAGPPITGDAVDEAYNEWTCASLEACKRAEYLSSRNVHKQVVNRLLEPFMWHTVIVTATDWENFFNLRISEFAQPEIRKAAECMKAALDESKPIEILLNNWHLPLIQLDEYVYTLEKRRKISVARCARVSYLTHDGVRNPEKDLELYERLKAGGHLSPFEHVATPDINGNQYYANFKGWIQMRSML